MDNIVFPDNKEFHRLWNLQTHSKKWKLYSRDECDKLESIIKDLQPKTIVDWGCGLARTSVSLFKEFNLTYTKWILCDITGYKVDNWVDEVGNKKKGGMGTFDHSDPLPYNDLRMTTQFCFANGMTNFETRDIRNETFLGYPDIFYSMHCVGYHFSIKSLLDKLNVNPKVMIFGIRKKKLNDEYDVVDVDELKGYSKRIIEGDCLQNYLIYERV